MWPNLQFPADLVIFTEEILNEKLHFLGSDSYLYQRLTPNTKKSDICRWGFTSIRYELWRTLSLENVESQNESNK